MRCGDKKLLLGVLLIIGITADGFAVLPPKYLSVADFQKCLATKNMGTWQSWCMPAKKLDACPNDSWKQLSGFTGKDRVPSC